MGTLKLKRCQSCAIKVYIEFSLKCEPVLTLNCSKFFWKTKLDQELYVIVPETQQIQNGDRLHNVVYILFCHRPIQRESLWLGIRTPLSVSVCVNKP